MRQDNSTRLTQAVKRDPNLSWVTDASLLFQTVFQYYVSPRLGDGPAEEYEQEIIDLFVEKFESGNPRVLLVVLCKRMARQIEKQPPTSKPSEKLDAMLKGLL